MKQTISSPTRANFERTDDLSDTQKETAAPSGGGAAVKVDFVKMNRIVLSEYHEHSVAAIYLRRRFGLTGSTAATVASLIWGAS